MRKRGSEGDYCEEFDTHRKITMHIRFVTDTSCVPGVSFGHLGI